MATINYWGLSGVKSSITVNLTITIDQLIAAIAADESLPTDYYKISVLDNPSINDTTYGDSSSTLTEIGIVDDDTVLCTPNQTGTKEDRQIQKLEIAKAARSSDVNSRANYDITQLPTRYTGNTVTDNPNVDGLVFGRPWIAAPADPFNGTVITWTDNTYFDSWTSQSGVTSSDLSPTNTLCWQLYYAHEQLTIPADAVNRLGLNTYLNGSNAINWLYSISTQDDTLGSFPLGQVFANRNSNSYTTGGFVEQDADTGITIPANRYFLLGIQGGPYYRTFKLLADSRTGYIGSTPYVTVFNTVYYGPHAQFATLTDQIPDDLGGTATQFVKYTDRVSVTSVKFKI